MGGIGSGEHNRTTRPIVEQCEKLTIRDLRWAGVLPTDNQGEDERLVWVEYAGHSLCVATTWQPSGGVRWWMHCPTCDGRVMKLYRPIKEVDWQCRICWNLGYLSRRLGRMEGLQRQAARMRHPLVIAAAVYGIAVRRAADVPKPKRMRWTTYARIMSRADDYERQARQLYREKLLRLLQATPGRRRTRPRKRSEAAT